MTELNLPSGLERRLEDPNLITGRAHYVDDLRPAPGRPSVLHMSVVRSPYAHAIIQHINLDAAKAMSGVVAAFTGAELVSDLPTLDVMPVPNLHKPERRPMAIDRVRYVGDPVAIILAEDRYTARDALDLVEVDYEPLPAVTDPEAALAPEAALLYPDLGSNIAFSNQLEGGDIESTFAQASRILHLRLLNQRLAPLSLEPRACLFDFDPASGILDAWLSSQAVYRARQTLATFLKLPVERIHAHNAEVGGAFGAKNALLGEEIIAALLAVRLRRPVKWIEGRSENLSAQTQGRGMLSYVEVAIQEDGRLLGLKVRTTADLGAFLASATAMVPNRMPSFLSGPYQVQAVKSEMIGVFTNKAPTAPYRGAGRPEAAYILERVMDHIAHTLNLDPAEVRRRNFIPPTSFPYTTVTGVCYDSGNYAAVLDKALSLVNYADWRAKQRERREQQHPRPIGVGISSFIELTGDNVTPPGPRESATVRIRRDGTLLVESGVSHSGQGHFTAFAQIAAQVFQLRASKVEVRMNDTSLPAFSIGTFGSRTLQIAGSAVQLAAEAVREKALQAASHLLEVSPADLILQNGEVMVQGTPSRRIALGELARLVEEQPDLIDQESSNPVALKGLTAHHEFASQGPAYASGTHIAVVEVDTETGDTHILRYVAIDDCGRVLNHYLAESQIHGSIAQGIGQALFEQVLYDQEGQLLTGTLMDYALPTASELPGFLTAIIETPSPLNPLGAKGVGEAGCIGAPPAIVNAVLDALAPYGIDALDMPLTPEKIWQALHSTP
ncbi:MAG TPA: xanthine dehydrogenase family protein molybdopterin-binding subunit [Ktedonobacteraceae bacterium]|jgi:carbon-monoxide dehydrogenase large subunit|nr:xanthine dehydrogenase family protein molybdopterin-binding subunit [Ktedonobacteraceae bacterium]